VERALRDNHSNEEMQIFRTSATYNIEIKKVSTYILGADNSSTSFTTFEEQLLFTESL